MTNLNINSNIAQRKVSGVPNIADASFYWTGQYDGTSLLNIKGANPTYVSGTGLDAIYDFSVLSDVRLNKNATINNILSLAEYYDPSFWTGIYLDTNNPYHWKLKDFHYRDIENQLATLSNIFFAQATYSGTVLQSINSLVIYNTELETSNLSQALRYVKYQLPIPTFVTEDRARLTPINDSVSYTGNVLTVGGAGTYDTITAAYAAASNGDIIDILNDLDMNNEAGNYLLINTVKNVLIRGNGFTLSSTSGGTYVVRVRTTGTLKFSDIAISSTSNINAFYMDSGLFVSNSTSIFENCDIKNTHTNALCYTVKLHGATNAQGIELINTTVRADFGLAISPTDVNPSSYLYLDNTNIFVNTTTALCYVNITPVKNYIYDSKMFLNLAAPVCQIGEDTDTPSDNYFVDIRGTEFGFLNGKVQHGLLIGRGVNDQYCINNISNGFKTTNTSSIGFVIKSIGVELADCVFKGNYSKSLKPFYIKGGQYNDVQYNVGVNNSFVSLVSSALHLTNSEEEISLNSNNNNITNNKLYGVEQTLLLNAAVGTEDIEITANTCTFDYNTYYTQNRDVWARSKGVDITFANKATLWTGFNDVNSNWQRIVQQDAYNNEF